MGLSPRVTSISFLAQDAITSGEFALKLEGSKRLAAMNYQSLCNRLHVIGMRLEQADVDVDVLPPLEAQGCLKTETWWTLRESLISTRWHKPLKSF